MQGSAGREEHESLHAVDSEKQVVGAVLVHAEGTLPRVRLNPGELYDPSLRAIFAAIRSCERDGKPIDAVTVAAELRASGMIDQLRSRGGEEYLTTLMAGIVTFENIEYHVGRVKDCAARRKGLDLGKELVNEISAGSDFRDTINRHIERLLALRDAGASTFPPTAAEILRSDSFKAPQRTYSTGIADFDEKIGGGVKARQLVAIAGPTGSGKTGFAGGVALTWIQQGIPVLWCGTEIDNEEQSARIAAIAFHRAELRATPDDILALRIEPTVAAEQVDSMPFYLLNLDDPDGDPFDMIERDAEQIASKHGQPPIVVLDYLQVLATEDEDKRRVSVSNVAVRLRRLARKLNMAVVAISSVSRAYYGRNAKRGGEEAQDPIDWLAAAKESGDIEYACAVFTYLDTSDEVDSLGEAAARLIVAKSRRGRRGFVGLRFHGPSGAFRPAADAITMMGPASKNGRYDAMVMKFVTAPRYTPMVLRDLRGAIPNMGGKAVDDAVNRLMDCGKLRYEEVKRPNSKGDLRPARVIVAADRNTSSNAAANSATQSS
jgi:replicative DNA helicase